VSQVSLYIAVVQNKHVVFKKQRDHLRKSADMLNASFGNRDVTRAVLRHHSASEVYYGLIKFNEKVSLKSFLYEVIFLSVPKEPYYCILKTVAFNYASNSE